MMVAHYPGSSWQEHVPVDPVLISWEVLASVQLTMMNNPNYAEQIGSPSESQVQVFLICC